MGPKRSTPQSAGVEAIGWRLSMAFELAERGRILRQDLVDAVEVLAGLGGASTRPSPRPAAAPSQ